MVTKEIRVEKQAWMIFINKKEKEIKIKVNVEGEACANLNEAKYNKHIKGSK